MKIYTKNGDLGYTSFLSGKRILKSDLRIESYGAVDELNSWIGLLRSQAVNKSREEELLEIQDRLFTIGSLLANDSENLKFKTPQLNTTDIDYLEQKIDAMEARLPKLKNFILPGGNQSVSYGHIARTVCRRVERKVVSLTLDSKIDDLVVKYLNRLSDYLFVLCRMMAQELGTTETPWEPRM